MKYDVLLTIISILILWKAASLFVEGAVGVAFLLRVPKMIIGLVLVSLATTSPELFTSLIAAIKGFPELALGNALGSVVVDASVALGVAAVVAVAPLRVDPAIFKISATTLIIVLSLAFLLVLDGTLSRIEGVLLLGGFVSYTAVLYRHYRKLHKENELDTLLEEEGLSSSKHRSTWWRVLFHFLIGLGGVLFGSEMLVRGASGLASALGMPPVVVGLTITAIGTSMPEIATCIASALKRESAIGVGNIIGADILNVCWVAGASAVANPLSAEKKVLLFMFPSALLVAGLMIFMLHQGFQLTRKNGAILVISYILYTAALFFIISPIPLSQ